MAPLISLLAAFASSRFDAPAQGVMAIAFVPAAPSNA
jgi:hypothetical protein